MKLQFYKVGTETFIGPVEQSDAEGLEKLCVVDGGSFESQVSRWLCKDNIDQLTAFNQMDNCAVRGTPFTPEEEAQAEYLAKCFELVKENAIKHVQNEQFQQILGK